MPNDDYLFGLASRLAGKQIDSSALSVPADLVATVQYTTGLNAAASLLIATPTLRRSLCMNSPQPAAMPRPNSDGSV